MTPTAPNNQSHAGASPGTAHHRAASLLDTASIGTPITRAHVSFFPLYLHQPDAPVILTGPASQLTIAEKESADVPVLEATNALDSPVLLVEGETVIGGLQHRTINVSVLVPGESRIDIPVSCVEAGRWSGQERAFEHSRVRSSTRVRAAKLDGINSSLRLRGDRRGDQGAVWTSIGEELSSRGIHSDTSAYHELESRAAGDGIYARAVESLVRRGPLPGQCGVVVSFGDRVLGVEVFATSEMLAAHWEAIVRTSLLDTFGSAARPAHRPALGRALRFVRRLATSHNAVSQGVGLGQERHVRDEVLVGQVLTWDATLVHASAFALAA